MSAKIKIMSTGDATYVELDGKTIGAGVEVVKFAHDAVSGAKLELSIDLNRFSFMPDGLFSEIERQLDEKEPPEDQLNGRTGFSVDESSISAFIDRYRASQDQDRPASAP